MWVRECWTDEKLYAAKLDVVSWIYTKRGFSCLSFLQIKYATQLTINAVICEKVNTAR